MKRLLALLRRSAQTITIPLFDGLSLYDVAIFFWKGIYEGAVTSRAASISFSFFLALFPGVIFVFTLIPFIPIDGFQHELFRLLRDVLPPNSFDAAYSTITDILTIKRGDLLGITVAAALFFATNGTLALIGNFGQTNYGAAKMGLVGFTRVLAVEGAKFNIKANAIAPLALTRMTETLMGNLADKLGPEEVTPIVAMLAHEDCPVSGNIFSVGGGRVANVFIGETQGYTKPGHTLEDLRDNWDAIMSQDGYFVPGNLADETGVFFEKLK